MISKGTPQTFPSLWTMCTKPSTRTHFKTQIWRCRINRGTSKSLSYPWLRAKDTVTRATDSRSQCRIDHCLRRAKLTNRRIIWWPNNNNSSSSNNNFKRNNNHLQIHIRKGINKTSISWVKAPTIRADSISKMVVLLSRCICELAILIMVELPRSGLSHNFLEEALLVVSIPRSSWATSALLANAHQFVLNASSMVSIKAIRFRPFGKRSQRSLHISTSLSTRLFRNVKNCRSKKQS